MKNFVFVIALILGLCVSVFSQDYNSAVGLRFGLPNSISYKTFIDDAIAVEGYVGFRSFLGYTEFRANAAYLINNDIESVDKLKWYYGGGAGAAFYSYDSVFTEYSGNIGLTLSAYLGLEYTLDDSPISFSVDWVPTMVLGGVSGFGSDNGSFAIRYVLGR